MDENIELQDSQTPVEVEEVVEADASADTEESTQEVDVEGLQKQNAKLYARMKRAEEALKATPQAPQPQKETVINNTPNQSEDAVDAKILESQGFSDEEIDRARKVAKVEDVSLIKATRDEMFTSWKASQDAKKKAEKAQLRGSKGSGLNKPQKTTNLSKEEHKALWNEKMGR
jgi:hypothetical protein